MNLGMIPRVRLASLPTPLQEAPNLTRALKGPRMFIKRDDMTGLAFGGNKVRKLEYLMADAMAHKADYIVTGASFHSNWCTTVAAAARKLGMKVVLVKRGPKDDYDPIEYDGNHLLHFLLGADMRIAGPSDSGSARVNGYKLEEKIVEELRAKGHTPYRLTSAGSSPIGVVAYVNAMLELQSQAVELGLDIDYLVLTTSSGGTHAGLLLGSEAFNTGIKIIGALPGSRTRQEGIDTVYKLANDSLNLLDVDVLVSKEDITLFDEYSGGAYGCITREKTEAVTLMAKTEGIFLDPVYTATSMSCLMDLCKKGFFKTDDVVVYLHTGGEPALFPYRQAFKAYATDQDPPWKIPPWT